jgi:hypothetical protein
MGRDLLGAAGDQEEVWFCNGTVNQSKRVDFLGTPARGCPGEHTRDRSVLVGKLAEILRDQRPTRKVAAMFIDMAFGSPIYERLRALGFNNVFETNFGLVHTPDHTKANLICGPTCGTR